MTDRGVSGGTTKTGEPTSGGDRWNAVISSAAQAPPAPWQVVSGTDDHNEPYVYVGFGEKNRGGWYEHDSTLLEDGQASFIAALGNWYFAHADARTGTPATAPPSLREVELERLVGRLEEALRAAIRVLAHAGYHAPIHPNYLTDAAEAARAALAGGTPPDTTRLAWQDDEGDVRCPDVVAEPGRPSEGQVRHLRRQLAEKCMEEHARWFDLTATANGRLERAEKAEGRLGRLEEALRRVEQRADRALADGHGYQDAVLSVFAIAAAALAGGTPQDTSQTDAGDGTSAVVAEEGRNV